MDGAGESALEEPLKEFDQAEACFQRARTLDADAGNIVGEAASVRSLGFLRQEAGDFLGALKLHKEALQLDRRAEFEYGIAIDQANVGAVYCELGDPGLALPYLRSALRAFEMWDYSQDAEKLGQLVRKAELESI